MDGFDGVRQAARARLPPPTPYASWTTGLRSWCGSACSYCTCAGTLPARVILGASVHAQVGPACSLVVPPAGSLCCCCAGLPGAEPVVPWRCNARGAGRSCQDHQRCFWQYSFGPAFTRFASRAPFPKTHWAVGSALPAGKALYQSAYPICRWGCTAQTHLTIAGRLMCSYLQPSRAVAGSWSLTVL
jgi:hypothetical protein